MISAEFFTAVVELVCFKNPIISPLVMVILAFGLGPSLEQAHLSEMSLPSIIMYLCYCFLPLLVPFILLLPMQFIDLALQQVCLHETS